MRDYRSGFNKSRKRGRKKRERELTRQEYLDSIATSTAFIPGLGDIAEFGSLANREHEGIDKPAWWEWGMLAVPGGLGAVGAAAGLIPKRTGKLADDTMPEKITAYHGSPHDFDKFSMSQIGTGEGAQAYGHGLYFAESEDVARGYRDALQKGSGATDDDVMARAIQAHDGDLEAAAKSLGERGNRLMESDPDKAQRFYQMQMRVMGGHNPSGRMYQVEIDASPDEFLDWDKPLSEQSEAVRKALGYSDNPNLDPKKKAYVDDFLKYDSMTEQDLYESLTFSNDYVKGMSPEDANVLVEYAKANRVRGDEMVTPEFAERARQAGIKGIRYKDGFSRGAEGGTSNYVVFDENIISIAKKYGIAIPAAAAMLYGDKADQYYEKEA